MIRKRSFSVRKRLVFSIRFVITSIFFFSILQVKKSPDIFVLIGTGNVNATVNQTDKFTVSDALPCIPVYFYDRRLFRLSKCQRSKLKKVPVSERWELLGWAWDLKSSLLIKLHIVNKDTSYQYQGNFNDRIWSLDQLKLQIVYRYWSSIKVVQFHLCTNPVSLPVPVPVMLQVFLSIFFS